MSPMLAHRMCDGIYSMRISFLPMPLPTLPSHTYTHIYLPSMNSLCVLFWFHFISTMNAYFSRLVSENRLAYWMEISACLVSVHTNIYRRIDTYTRWRIYTILWLYIILLFRWIFHINFIAIHIQNSVCNSTRWKNEELSLVVK